MPSGRRSTGSSGRSTRASYTDYERFHFWGYGETPIKDIEVHEEDESAPVLLGPDGKWLPRVTGTIKQGFMGFFKLKERG